MLSSWSLRVGIILLLAICTYVPWNREMQYRISDRLGTTFHDVRYGWIWDSPFGHLGNIDFGRLALEILGLSVLVSVGYVYERHRNRPGVIGFVPPLDHEFLAARKVELTEKLIADLPEALTLTRLGTRVASGDEKWQVNDAEGVVIGVLYVTERAVRGDRDLLADLRRQDWLDELKKNGFCKLHDDGVLRPATSA